MIDNHQPPCPDTNTQTGKGRRGGAGERTLVPPHPRYLYPFTYNLLSHNCRFVFSANGSALCNPVTVTAHAFRYRYAVTLSPVTVTGHAFRYCYCVTPAPLFLAYAPRLPVNRAPW